MSELLLVSALLRAPELLAVVPDLATDHFRDFKPRLIYQTLRNVEAQGDPITVDTVLERLERDGYGDALSDGRANGARVFLEERVASVPEKFGATSDDVDRVEQLASALVGEQDVQRAAERDAEADELEIPVAPPTQWRTGMIPDKYGAPAKRVFNLRKLLSAHPLFVGKFSLDIMTNTPHFAGLPLTEETVTKMVCDIENEIGWSPPREWVTSTISLLSSERSFHPIRQYLESLQWDGVHRLDSVAPTYLRTPDRVHAVMVRKFMIGAVARAMRPGCKLDTALMLVGAQGIGKSTFFNVLGGQWHVDTYADITTRDGMLVMHSSWLYEMAELENVVWGKSESLIKAAITSATDSFRAPYARESQHRPRSFAICGSTNKAEILTDDTGSRRFWIVPVHGVIDRAALTMARDQIWAEAVHAYRDGEAWWLSQADETERSRSNEGFSVSDSWVEIISKHLHQRVSDITVSEALENAIGLKPGQHGRSEQTRAGKALTACGWHRRRVWVGPVQTTVYRKPVLLG